MLTYVYETLPRAGKKTRRYEFQQSIKDAPLKQHPATGEPIRRCIVLGADPFVRAATIERPEPRPAKRSRQHDDHHAHHHDHDHHH
ncbi:MAG: hypothetical protein Q8N18_18750 [Opitutaceae bacterium]|nr:hypothetical protein [Opitutaceae bacterium]